LFNRTTYFLTIVSLAATNHLHRRLATVEIQKTPSNAMTRGTRGQQVSLVHGDYGLGNFLERDGRISAILDWELVHLGDPIEDLGWAFLPQYRGGTSLVCGLADEVDFISRYEAQSGLNVAAASLKFYIVFSLMKLAFTNMAVARCFEDGLFNDMRMPAMATQVAPVFRQIAKTLEGT
jgi:aminoglycoside phosphotransferase (APT) family kinase protein